MIRKLLYACFLICITALCSPVFAQLNANNLTYYPESGGTFVYDVLSDKMGNIWLATQNGLMRYDGYEFKLFHQDPKDENTIGSILTYALHEDRNGNIWIGCTEIISVYNPHTKTFKNYNFIELAGTPLHIQPAVHEITSDSNGRVYFGLGSGLDNEIIASVLYYSEEDDEFNRINTGERLKIANVHSAASDSAGNVWLRSWNGLFRIDATGKVGQIDIPESPDHEGEYSFSPIEVDKSGLIWMVSDYLELYSFDPKSGKSQYYSLRDVMSGMADRIFISEIVFDTSDDIWIGTSHGLIFFDRSEKSFNVLSGSDESNIGVWHVNTLKFDEFGDLWIGTQSQGVLKYSLRSLFKSFLSTNTDDIKLTAGWASKICESSDGRVWVGTSAGFGHPGLNAIDPNIDSVDMYSANLIHPDLRWINSLVEDKPGEILIDGGGDFFIFDAKSSTCVKTMFDGVPDSIIAESMFKDSRNNLWLCAALNGLYFREGHDTSFSHIQIPGSGDGETANVIVTKVHESSNHGLWVATGDGLYLYDYVTRNLVRHGFDQESGDVFISQDINALCIDRNGIVWVGTWAGGLSRYDVESGSIRTYTMMDGLPSMNIQGILEDEDNGELWISTFEGLSRFNIEAEQFNNFSLIDGIQGRLFAEGGYLETRGGYFVFGGSNGVNIFRPEDIAKNSLPPKVYITKFEIVGLSFDEDVSPVILDPTLKSEEILLGHSQNNLAIGYVGIHYANPAKNKFAYKLENYDSDWRDVGNQRSAYYNNIPPGNYVFKVKAANSNGVWSDEGVMLNINIAPPWWRTWWAYVIYSILLLAGIYVVERALRRRVVEKQKALAREKELAQAKEIEKAYEKLKATQSQLVHAEKMASLGELTAGIAHEIQNPLNFVNNFAEVSVDLLDEMDEEMVNGNTAEVRSIAVDLKQNLDKINSHGQRASGIVKGMLEHSRAGDGTKEPVDINALADEYLRLAYHGLRAKDKSFNADFKTDLDKSLPKIDLIPQEMGRVLLNLINNAFHAVRERSKEEDTEYQPTVIIKTGKANDGQVEIKVEDNGNGIPQNVLDKIFQPFFTTKPTGEGTGLGLSLSYDIIKAHGGELKVETKERKGTTFIILLPHKS